MHASWCAAVCLQLLDLQCIHWFTGFSTLQYNKRRQQARAQLVTGWRRRLHLRSRKASSSSATPSICDLSTSSPPTMP
jgi:hypothetical protein